MYQLELRQPRQELLPLPAAALVIDLRGFDDDETIERLKIEIADLTNEMRTEEIYHWRYLSDFLSFWSRHPLSIESIATLRPQPPTNGAVAPTNQPASPGGTLAPTQRGLTGTIAPATQQLGATPIFYQSANGGTTLSEESPKERLATDIKKIIEEADRLRHNRAVAITDLGPDLAGPNIKDKTVRVILLVDAQRPESLATASAYAVHLQEHNQKWGHLQQGVLLSPTVLCLNVSGQAASSELSELLWEKRWDHIDAVIISERYRYDGLRIDGPVQTYLAELLLSVLLLVPPLPVNEDTPGTGAHASPPASQASAPVNQAAPPAGQGSAPAGQTAPAGQVETVAYPPNAFVAGLATMEHSGRWARHLLNFMAVERSIEVLQQDQEAERDSVKSTVHKWFDTWRGFISKCIPHTVPETITGIHGIAQAARALEEPAQVFTVRGLSWSLGRTTIVDLQRYLDKLIATYSIQGANRAGAPGLQEAINSRSHIEQQLKVWEGMDPDLRKEQPLASAHLEAQHILSQRGFFNGADGAIARARMQLEELSARVATWRGERKHADPQKQGQDLHSRGRSQIAALAKDIDSLPLLCSMPLLKGVAAWATFLIALAMSALAAFIAMAWLHQWLLSTGFTPIFNDLLLYSISPFALVFWLVVLAIVLALAITAGRGLLRPARKPWEVEIGLGIVLVVLAILGWVVSISLGALSADGVSFALLNWLAFLPAVGVVALVLAILLVLLEIGYFIWWLGHVQAERQLLVQEWNTKHRENIAEVTNAIADDIALFLLERTELVTKKGEPGSYYERLNRLSDHFRNLLLLARRRQQMAQHRLRLSVSKEQPGTTCDPQSPWRNLRIRDEQLDVAALADGYTRFKEQLGQEMEELQELAEQLLRTLGQEQPAHLEKEFRERTLARHSVRRYAQVLMTTLVATAQRISIQAGALTSIKPLVGRYKALENSAPFQVHLLKALIASINDHLTQAMLQPLLENTTSAKQMEIYALSIDAFEMWGQMLWQSKDHELEQAISMDGVLPRLLSPQDNSASIKKLLGLRASLLGQNVEAKQRGTLYLLIPTSPHSHAFRQSLNLPPQNLIEFPDEERLILLHVQRYAAPPMQIQIAAPASATASTSGQGTTP